jgi:hypothetical protein
MDDNHKSDSHAWEDVICHTELLDVDELDFEDNGE